MRPMRMKIIHRSNPAASSLWQTARNRQAALGDEAAVTPLYSRKMRFLKIGPRGAWELLSRLCVSSCVVGNSLACMLERLEACLNLNC